MKIRETQIARCAFSAAIDIAKDFFDRADGPGLSPLESSSVRCRRSCLVIPDHTDRARRHHALHLGWCEHHALSPATFEGLLTVRPASGYVELILEGELVGHGSARVLLADLVAHIENEWRHFCAETPSIEACNARKNSEMALA